jgi:hypothetical protein
MPVEIEGKEPVGTTPVEIEGKARTEPVETSPFWRVAWWNSAFAALRAWAPGPRGEDPSLREVSRPFRRVAV